MRTWITDTARDLINDLPPGGPVTLDEIAACAGITTHHLRAYYSSIHAITAELKASSPSTTRFGRC